jgi:elongation factor 1-alpha
MLGVGTVLVGQVTSGILRTGMKALIEERTVEVLSMEAHHKKMDKANPGETVGARIGGTDYKFLKSLVGKHIEFL